MSEFKSNKDRDYEMRNQLSSKGIDSSEYSARQMGLLHKIKSECGRSMVKGAAIGAFAGYPVLGVGAIPGAAIGAVAGIGVCAYGSGAYAIQSIFNRMEDDLDKDLKK